MSSLFPEYVQEISAPVERIRYAECVNCSKRVVISKYSRGYKRFCSRVCNQQYWRAHRNAPREKICVDCGAPFQFVSHYRGPMPDRCPLHHVKRAKFASRLTAKILACAICGSEFIFPAHAKGAIPIFCPAHRRK